ncbi:MAG TPA: hypothetical protein VN832_00135 [Stellaceae bacterium]|nr:hypothetical protein [Stellaceae bacterium]
MATIAVASPQNSGPGQAKLTADADAAPPASLASIPVSRGRTPVEICDKPGELTLLLQLSRGRAPKVGALDRNLFDAGESALLIGDATAPLRSSWPRRITRTIYRYFFSFPEKDRNVYQKTSSDICSGG